MIIGVDLGNYAVKTSEKVHFLSKISEMDSFTGDNKVVYNSKTIFIGEGEFSTDWNKSQKESTLPLLFAAIAMSTNENINRVVIGLPIQQYKANKEELKELISNNRCASINSRRMLIEDVEVAPEGASVYYNMPIEELELYPLEFKVNKEEKWKIGQVLKRAEYNNVDELIRNSLYEMIK